MIPQVVPGSSPQSEHRQFPKRSLAQWDFHYLLGRFPNTDLLLMDLVVFRRSKLFRGKK